MSEFEVDLCRFWYGQKNEEAGGSRVRLQYYLGVLQEHDRDNGKGRYVVRWCEGVTSLTYSPSTYRDQGQSKPEWSYRTKGEQETALTIATRYFQACIRTAAKSGYEAWKYKERSEHEAHDKTLAAWRADHDGLLRWGGHPPWWPVRDGMTLPPLVKAVTPRSKFGGHSFTKKVPPPGETKVPPPVMGSGGVILDDPEELIEDYKRKVRAKAASVKVEVKTRRVGCFRVVVKE
jgi:hypothetical protein